MYINADRVFRIFFFAENIREVSGLQISHVWHMIHSTCCSTKFVSYVTIVRHLDIIRINGSG